LADPTRRQTKSFGCLGSRVTCRKHFGKLPAADSHAIQPLGYVNPRSRGFGWGAPTVFDDYFPPTVFRLNSAGIETFDLEPSALLSQPGEHVSTAIGASGEPAAFDSQHGNAGDSQGKRIGVATALHQTHEEYQRDGDCLSLGFFAINLR
jgi:hypothetical protein